ncbi:hypothetical protein CSB45_05935 [candidate division KSB3 bacterium]|uniref:ATP-binding protein n=1 Tax=candidate division KSB3 bacterium TaxID=2044937 RepID=A0A2G6E6U7_9BACT|nr:MAG: hypothetical protein CSB45_05935 [candidate division KSB3 bacterium]PIE30190.1 MAG: hypothetical protein CSA57_04655 [candidate division KSB3 bacterium]
MPTLFHADRESAGFRLHMVEIYNWGTFDKKIWRLSPRGRHSLLTGANGSGKTTLVDALLTLLVPASRRFYNQSSGADKRRERDEKSYCLGAYGNIQSEHKAAASTQYLRTKEDYSILLANFRDEDMQQDVTLAQIRWFSNNELKRVYLFSPRHLTIREHCIPLDSAGEWKRRLRAIDRTELFDSFTKYSQKFSKVFGFKSAKALSLFAHTVGIKVLGNLNEFIRANMLEESDVDEEFRKLREHYDSLLSVHNTIEKAREQLRVLEPVIEQGKIYRRIEDELREIEKTLEIIPACFAREAIDLLEEACRLKAHSLEQVEHKIEEIRKDIERLEGQRTDIEIAIGKDETGEQIHNIEREIDSVGKERDSRKSRAREYHALAEMLGYSHDPDEQGFYENMRCAKTQRRDLEEELPALNESWSDLRGTLQKYRQENKSLLEEIRSLEGRKNQIPLKNISIRNGLLQSLNASEEELPFIGELIKVRHTEKVWERSIERLLHNFALILLVPGKYYRQVNLYVNSTDLMGRLVYYNVDPQRIDFADQDEHPNSLLTKLEIDPASAYHDWVRMQLLRNYNYICTESLQDFQRYEKALTREGLIKTHKRHEKDDRIQASRQSNYVLGWDNSEKIEVIQAQRRKLDRSIDGITLRIREIERKREDLAMTRDLLNKVLAFSDYYEIDWQKHVLKIQQLSDEQERLKAGSDLLQELERQLRQVKEQIRLARKEDDLLGEQRANLKRDAQEYDKQCAEKQALLEAYQHVDLEDYTSRLAPYLAEQSHPTVTLKNIGAISTAVRDRVYQELKQKRREKSKGEIALVRHMHSFKTPSEELTRKYPGWTADTLDLEDTPESLNEYSALYRRIKEEDLPRHEQRFKTWLNERVIVNFASFETSLDKQFKAIKTGIRELNACLREIEFHSTPPTYIQIDDKEIRDRGESGVTMFRQSLRDVFSRLRQLHEADALEESFMKVKAIIERMTHDESWRQKVTDVRNWLEFGAIEKHRLDDSPKRYYDDSQGLSGGEKAKLAYTILASAIAYQFGIDQKDKQLKSFRFVVVDEAFSKVDPENALFAMELFKQLNLQLMVVTPLDKINVVEKFIHTVHYTENKNRRNSAVYDLTIQEYHRQKARVNSGQARGGMNIPAAGHVK